MLTMYLAMLGSEEDRERFTLLYEAHEKRLYAVALKVLRDPTRAEDAAQQTWLQVLRPNIWLWRPGTRRWTC